MSSGPASNAAPQHGRTAALINPSTQEEERVMLAGVDGRKESGQHDPAILSASGQAGQATSSFQLCTPGPLCPSQFSLELSTEGCCLLLSWLFTGGNWVPEFVPVTALSQHSTMVSYFLSLFLNSLSDPLGTLWPFLRSLKRVHRGLQYCLPYVFVLSKPCTI